MATITFYGAAQEVTGSCHMVESSSFGRVLLDCGMHQGGHNVERMQKEEFEFNPNKIEAVILSHAHLDHCGMLPKLVNQGFCGHICCSSATQGLLGVMLRDSVGIYLSDLERENVRRARKGKKPLLPEYDDEDVVDTLALCKGVEYGKQVEVLNGLRVEFQDAGHILGSAIVSLFIDENNTSKKLVFSGDLGNKNAVLMKDPSIIEEADVVLMEGTYGDRNHRDIEDTVEQLKTILIDTEARGGNILIPAFAVGRTQEILFYLGTLHNEGLLKNWHVALDSPMAIEVTRVYDKWFRSLDQDEIQLATPLATSILEDFIPNLYLSVSVEESIAINRLKKGVIIIAGSGMCTGGRIRHHFKQRIWDSRNTIIFCGYQANGTLGRLIVDGKKHIKMFNDDFAVKAQIETLGGFSAHAGQDQLLDWLKGFKNKPSVVLVHGEPMALDALSTRIWQDLNIRVKVPARGESMVF
ncbi:MBL fold metallo-hydrolase RNA specificity domain-containing protein [Brumicola nitratireducens]|uniref:RNA-metabolising metallo-beta-lactamase n=1 Tax=Glaciecola nitratireducens (strain JCM 12485 / KCTC 12276 / FR1064) TaxID=1085623 RepID=G4QE93_GLANF|nr:MBL fold metallo-hydrolase [Glaciecola nitratireducens]AEP31367.1 RNA-metabolising metallo-beta-lactamase [Glaciecola nitratireducens FR1064]